MEVYVDDEAKLTLHGLQQHYVKIKENEKNRKLFELLDALEFNQVVIFVKSVQRCMALAQLLVEQNFPAIAIHRAMQQEERLSRYQQFKDFQKRILVATNLFGRGMDIERVNIVFNYDMPEDSDTYLHRVARAGRFGTKGLAVTFVSEESDAKTLNEVQERFDVNITELPDEIDLSSYIEGRWGCRCVCTSEVRQSRSVDVIVFGGIADASSTLYSQIKTFFLLFPKTSRTDGFKVLEKN